MYIYIHLLNLIYLYLILYEYDHIHRTKNEKDVLGSKIFPRDKEKICIYDIICK